MLFFSNELKKNTHLLVVLSFLIILFYWLLQMQPFQTVTQNLNHKQVFKWRSVENLRDENSKKLFERLVIIKKNKDKSIKLLF